MDLFFLDNKDYFHREVSRFETRPKKIDYASPVALADSDILIGARIRPLLPKEVEAGHIAGVFVGKGHAIANVHELKLTVKGFPALNSSTFQLDRLYGPDNTSEYVYRDLLEPLIPWAWGGGVSTLFAYGQTGSGKTHTVNELEKLAAIKLLSGSLEGKREVSLCIFELAGKNAHDLLNDRHEVKLLEDSFGEMQLSGVMEHKPSGAEELVALIEKGMSFRKSAATLKNDTSSRTHAICRIRIANQEYAEIPDGFLFLVDLAGNEAPNDRKEHNQARMKETKEISLSLATLKDCIRGRALWGTTQKGTKGVHVPYRNAVLTKVLKHVFDIKDERACKTAVLACATPSVADCGPTKNTFRYAEILRIPVPKPKPVIPMVNTPSTWSNKNLRRWIDEKSGNPPISSRILAPSENGIELCKLPKGEFIARCLKTPDITQAQALAFYDKLACLQNESQTGKKADEPLLDEEKKTMSASTSPFQERLGPGTFIPCKEKSWQDKGKAVQLTSDSKMAMVMAPHIVEGAADKTRFLCAEVAKGQLHGSYVLYVTRQVVIPTEQMEEEVLLTYDDASRYYLLEI